MKKNFKIMLLGICIIGGISMSSCASGVYDMENQIYELEKQVAELEETQKIKDQQINELNAQLTAEKNNTSEFEAVQAEWETSRSELENQITELQETIEEMESDGRQELQERLEETIAAVDEAHAQAKSYLEEISTLTTENEQLLHQVAVLQNNVETYLETIEAWKYRVAELNIKLQESENSKQVALSNYIDVVNLYNSLYLENESLTNSIDLLNTTIEHLTAENEELRAKLEQYENAAVEE